MRKMTTNPENLVAPCGMNCANCSRYLSYTNNLKRSQCRGCRAENKICSYLFAKCTGINHSLEGTATARFCFECDLYPCQEIDRMDKRYRSGYQVSVKENLESIRDKGIVTFIEEQRDSYRCPKCADAISIHNNKCFRCDEITRLVEKS